MMEHGADSNTYARSKLPGGLGVEAESAAHVRENFVHELHLAPGCGLSLTDTSLIVIQAGIRKVGILQLRRSAIFAHGQVIDLALEEKKSKEGEFILKLIVVDTEAPKWAIELPVAKDKVTKVFRFCKFFWLYTHELHLNRDKLPPPSLKCRYCEAPLTEYSEG